MSTEPATNEQRLDWDEAIMRPITPSGFMLVIRGVARFPMDVRLNPLPIGIAPEDYQGTEVLGTPRGDVTKETPWGVEVNPGTLPVGRRGFVLVGATKREYFPPKED